MSADAVTTFCDPYIGYIAAYSCGCHTMEARKKDLPTWCYKCGKGTLSKVHRCEFNGRDELVREVPVRKPLARNTP